MIFSCCSSLAGSSIRIGLAGMHQRMNAALAVALAGAWEASPAARACKGEHARLRAEAVTNHVLPIEYIEGLAAARWPGRAQVGVLVGLGYIYAQPCPRC
jgi:hypothetical protein